MVVVRERSQGDGSIVHNAGYYHQDRAELAVTRGRLLSNQRLGQHTPERCLDGSAALRARTASEARWHRPRLPSPLSLVYSVALMISLAASSRCNQLPHLGSSKGTSPSTW